MSVAKPLEAAVLRACLDYLQLRRILCWRSNNAAVRRKDRAGREWYQFSGLRGVPDILGVLPGGRLLAVECKRPGGKPTPEQDAFLQAVRAAGGLALLVDDVRQLAEALEGLP